MGFPQSPEGEAGRDSEDPKPEIGNILPCFYQLSHRPCVGQGLWESPAYCTLAWLCPSCTLGRKHLSFLWFVRQNLPWRLGSPTPSHLPGVESSREQGGALDLTALLPSVAQVCSLKCWFLQIFYAEKEGKFIVAIIFSQSSEQAIRSKGA